MLACGSHGNETVTSWVVKNWKRLSREAGESASLESLGLFPPQKEKAGFTGWLLCFPGLHPPYYITHFQCIGGPGSPASFHVVRIISKPPNTMKASILLQIRETMILQGTVSLVYLIQEPMGKAASYIYRPGNICKYGNRQISHFSYRTILILIDTREKIFLLS